MTRTGITVTLELEPNAAAALYRLCDKLGHSDAMAYLYSHLPRELRSRQAYEMLSACSVVQKTLADAGVGAFPWIDRGDAQ